MAALLLAGSLVAAAPLHAAAGGCCAAVYVHRTTPGNTAYDYTDLDNVISNNNPNAIVFVAPVWNPGGSTAPRFDYHNVGVWWHAATQRWSIFNEDGATMPVGAAFNVYALSQADSYDTIVHTTTVANSAGDFTRVNLPYANGQPGRQLLFTPVWNPRGGIGTYDAPAGGVWYYGGQWTIFHEDLSSVTIGASFFVYAVNPATPGLSLHTATAANTNHTITCIDNPRLNGNPNGIAFVTQNLNPGGGFGGTYNNSVPALFYSWDYARWCIWNENAAPIPIGASFNVLAT